MLPQSSIIRTKFSSELSKSLLTLCIISGVVFSLAAAIVLYGALTGKKIIERRRLSSLKIKPESELKPLAFQNHYFEGTPSPVSAARVELTIEDF